MAIIYVTKYALSSGVFKTDAVLKNDGTFASWHYNGWPQYASGKDFWLTEAEALADCERRRAAKLASIEKQRKKLEAMQFTIN